MMWYVAMSSLRATAGARKSLGSTRTTAVDSTFETRYQNVARLVRRLAQNPDVIVRAEPLANGIRIHLDKEFELNEQRRELLRVLDPDLHIEHADGHVRLRVMRRGAVTSSSERALAWARLARVLCVLLLLVCVAVLSRAVPQKYGVCRVAPQWCVV